MQNYLPKQLYAWVGPKPRTPIATKAEEAGFVDGPQRCESIPCPQEAAQIAVLSMFGPLKKPVAWAAIFFRRAFQPVRVFLLVAAHIGIVYWQITRCPEVC